MFKIEDVKSIAEKLGVEFKDFNLSDLYMGMLVELEHKDVTKGDAEMTAKIALAHLKEDPKYYEKLKKIENKLNAKDYAKVYSAKYMEKGVWTYKEESVYLNLETLHKMAPSIVGVPVCVYHDEKINPENMEERADGYVVRSWYNESDGAFWCDFVVFTEKGKKAANEMKSVSCAYIPTAYAEGGTYLATPYDREIKDGQYIHLAIVPDPRLEDSVIYEHSKDKKEEAKKMFKIFTTKKVEKEIDNVDVELENGETIKLNSLISAFVNSEKKNEEDKEKDVEKLNAESDGDKEIDIPEVGKVTLGDLVNCYKKNMKKNEEEKEEDKDEKKENEEDEDKDDKEDKDETKSNALSDAHKKALSYDSSEVIRAWTDTRGVEQGKKDFGM